MKIRNLFALALLITAQSIGAHPDHTPPKIAECKTDVCTQDEIRTGGLRAISMLVKLGSVAQSWKQVNKASGIDKQSDTWIVRFQNMAEKDLKKRTLYVFVTTDGYMIGSNFTGK